MGGMGGYISSLVILMDRDVEAHELMEGRISEADLVGIVSRVVEGSVTSGDIGIVSVDVVVDNGSDSVDFRAEVEAVLKSAFPVLGLVDASVVLPHKMGTRLAHKDTC